MMNTERKLATVRKIVEVKDIPNADLIQAYRVDGWWIVDRKNAYQVGDLVIYCEIDSWIPHDIAPFLSKGKEPRIYEKIKGERLKTIKLKGQLSQGLFLPLSVLSVLPDGSVTYEGDDVTEKLGIVKWELPIATQLRGQIKGGLPWFIKKTDQERIQNLTKKFDEWKDQGYIWEVTEKLDGSSCTIFIKDGEVGVCSRNLELKEDENNAFWKVALQGDIPLVNKLRKMNGNYALQGELIGEGIQGNSYNIKGLDFYLFDVWDIDKQRYLYPSERRSLATVFDIKHVPIVSKWENLYDFSIDDILSHANGESQIYKTKREGIVFKCYNDPSISFKAISNEWLLMKK